MNKIDNSLLKYKLTPIEDIDSLIVRYQKNKDDPNGIYDIYTHIIAQENQFRNNIPLYLNEEKGIFLMSLFRKMGDYELELFIFNILNKNNLNSEPHFLIEALFLLAKAYQQVDIVTVALITPIVHCHNYIMQDAYSRLVREGNVDRETWLSEFIGYLIENGDEYLINAALILIKNYRDVLFQSSPKALLPFALKAFLVSNDEIKECALDYVLNSSSVEYENCKKEVFSKILENIRIQCLTELVNKFGLEAFKIFVDLVQSWHLKDDMNVKKLFIVFLSHCESDQAFEIWNQNADLSLVEEFIEGLNPTEYSILFSLLKMCLKVGKAEILQKSIVKGIYKHDLIYLLPANQNLNAFLKKTSDQDDDVPVGDFFIKKLVLDARAPWLEKAGCGSFANDVVHSLLEFIVNPKALTNKCDKLSEMYSACLTSLINKSEMFIEMYALSLKWGVFSYVEFFENVLIDKLELEGIHFYLIIYELAREEFKAKIISSIIFYATLEDMLVFLNKYPEAFKKIKLMRKSILLEFLSPSCVIKLKFAEELDVTDCYLEQGTLTAILQCNRLRKLSFTVNKFSEEELIKVQEVKVEELTAIGSCSEHLNLFSKWPLTVLRLPQFEIGNHLFEPFNFPHQLKEFYMSSIGELTLPMAQSIFFRGFVYQYLTSSPLRVLHLDLEINANAAMIIEKNHTHISNFRFNFTRMPFNLRRMCLNLPLEKLSVYSFYKGEEVISQLPPSMRLKNLQLFHLKDKDIEKLNELFPNLEVLKIGQSPALTDHVYTELASFSQLRKLEIPSTPKGLSYLMALSKHLKTLTKVYFLESILLNESKLAIVNMLKARGITLKFK